MPPDAVEETRRSLIIGTAGHIDHGKTRLVRCLTGIDTDRLPEEKRRGISIDLGFAHFEAGDFRFGVVDVPGHERFVRNMVAGASGIDLGLLVVAADDGVMPQTREHLEIMNLLGVSTGVVAVTKCDLVDLLTRSLVLEEIAELTAGTFLASAAVVPVSCPTAEGIDLLRQELISAAGRFKTPPAIPYFRLPIDRAFAFPGHGVIVTGTALSGTVHPGDELELLPSGRRVRVRSVQSHGRDVSAGVARQRTAVNLAGVRNEEIRRGQELATPDCLSPTNRLLVELRVLKSAGRGVRHRDTCLLYLGTCEVRSRVIRKIGEILPGETGFVELRTDEPVVAGWGQRFLLRRLSPSATIAGGVVLDPVIAPRERIADFESEAAMCRHHDDTVRLSRLVRKLGTIAEAPSPLARRNRTSEDIDFERFVRLAWFRAGIRPEEIVERVDSLKRKGELIAPANVKGLLIHRTEWEVKRTALMRAIRESLKALQPRRTLTRREFDSVTKPLMPGSLRDAILDELISSGELAVNGVRIGPADALPVLTKRQQRLQILMQKAITDGGLMPPTLQQMATTLRSTIEELQPLIDLCVEEDQFVRLDDGIYVTPESLERGRRIAVSWFRTHPTATMSQLREAWGVTRKYSLPFCGWYDARGVTIRDGDIRKPGPALDETIPGL